MFLGYIQNEYVNESHVLLKCILNVYLSFKLNLLSSTSKAKNNEPFGNEVHKSKSDS